MAYMVSETFFSDSESQAVIRNFDGTGPSQFRNTLEQHGFSEKANACA